MELDGILFSGLICLENICLMTVIDYRVNYELRAFIILYEEILFIHLALMYLIKDIRHGR